MPATSPESRHLLTHVLRDVSRSFYLTLRILPAAVRDQIGLGYLLARATDTIADTELVPVAERLEALAQLRDRILGLSWSPLDLARFVDLSNQNAITSGERALLQRLEDCLALLDTFSTDDQDRIRRVLETITSGQELDLERFGARAAATGSRATPPAPQITALASLEELHDYTHRVAGCVGLFWTEMCRAHLFPEAPIDEVQFRDDGVRFGRGLQMVNILRDLSADLRHGRCYLPADRLKALGLKPRDLLDASAARRLSPLYRELLNFAQAHLEAGWRYTCAIPEGQRRVRLACAWPLLIGARTLRLLRDGNPLDVALRIKVSRTEVKWIVLQSVFRLPFRESWEDLFARWRR
jgi:farnesyl-diphosphate farnesyltransferase